MMELCPVETVCTLPGRPRERLLEFGAETLSDSELLAVLLGWGSKGKHVDLLACEVLAQFDRKAGRIRAEELTQICGLGQAKAAIVLASLEFARRMLCPGKHRIGFPCDVLPLIRHYADRKQEHFLCLSLNGAHEVTAVRVVSVGLVNRAIVHPREVFADPLTDRAAAVIVAHNHPSGNVEPSEEDRHVTQRLAQAGKTLGVSLLDHIIFGNSAYYSFLEHGTLP